MRKVALSVMVGLLFAVPAGADRIVILEEDFETEDGWEEDPENDYIILPDGQTWYALDEAILPTPAYLIEIFDGGTGMSSVQYGVEIPVIPDVFEDPSGMASMGWLIDFTVWTNKAPYTLRPIICNSEDPWAGTSDTVVVPDGFQEREITYRVLLPATDVLYTDMILFILHLGGQGEVTLGFDDITVTAAEAFLLYTMEPGTARRGVRTTTGAISFTDDGLAAHGVGAARHEITEGGSALTDCEVTMLCRPPVIPERNFRISIAAYSEKTPYNFRLGIRDRSTGETRAAGEVHTITEAGQWEEFSSVVASLPSRSLEVVIWDGGQGAAEFLFDDVLVEWTDEEAPAALSDWTIY